MFRPSPPLSPSGRKLPERFGRYLLVERIGSGGMAEVFRGVTFGWEGFRRVLVVKRIRRELGDSPTFLKMFFDEAKVSALLHHPNVVQVYDFGQVEGAYFLAMEHIDGKDLGAVLRALRAERMELSPSLVALIGREIAHGLSYAHTLVSADGRPFDIVHRDINPSNVMLVRTGGVKVLDFGIAKASEAAGKTQTQRAMLKGKLSYLSPEQARTEPLDARSDLFSWGSTIWEVLTGHRLFRGQADFERLHSVKHAEIVPPSRHRADIPPELDRIIMRALERDVDRRYQSAAELAGDLDAYLARFPPEPDGIARVLSELFGEEPSRSLVLPAEEMPDGISGAGLDAGPGAEAGGPASGAVSGSLSGALVSGQVITTETYASSDSLPARLRGTLSGVHASPGSVSAAVPAPPARRSGLLWTAVGAVAVAAVAALLWSFRAGPVAPRAIPAPGLDPSLSAGTERGAAAAPSAAASAPAGELAAIEVDSEPSGATVFSGSGHQLGITPFTLHLPASTENENLRFEKPGYETSTYEVRPRSAGVVFVELRPLGGAKP